MSDDWELHLGDNLEALRKMADGSVDAVVSDPPYGLSDHSPEDIAIALTAWLKGESYTHGKGGFMGKGWDSFVPGPILWKECFRVLKPGGHLLAFAGSRTLDLMGMSLRLAGFEIRDGIAWLHGQGFPKSHDVSKALDKVAGTEFSERPAEGVGFMRPDGRGGYHVTRNRLDRVGESSPEAQEWAGWGTALKPAFEPVVVARKPMMGTVAANVLAHGTGALNIDGCRVSWGSEAPTQEEWNQKGASAGGVHYGQISDGMRAAYAEGKIPAPTGRWPSNVILGHTEECERVGTKRVKANTEGSGKLWSHYRDNTEDQAEARKSRIGDDDGYETIESWNCVPECPVSELDAQSGNLHGAYVNGDKAAAKLAGQSRTVSDSVTSFDGGKTTSNVYLDRGGASRFFYTAKASKNERTANGRVPNNHPTVKPLALMRYLCRLVTPPGGVVLDPFMGSGTTGVAARQEGFRFVGMEKDEDSYETARGRINLALEPQLWTDPVKETPPPVQTTLSDLLGFGDD